MQDSSHFASASRDRNTRMKHYFVELKEIPEEFRGRRREANLLFYYDSRILVATDTSDTVLGSVRVACRVGKKSSGLITDLLVSEGNKGFGLEDELLKQAEVRLWEMGVREVDGLCLDGVNHVRYFYRAGFKPFRRTVFIGWDLTKELQIEINPELEIKVFDSFDNVLVETILNSKHPYWTPWQEKEGIRKILDSLFKDKEYKVFVAYSFGNAVGLVDVRPQAPSLNFGVVVRKDFGGRKLGSTLLSTALSYLKQLGQIYISTVSTSGLDDYDPQIYLYTLSGGKIEKEYIDLRKD